MSEPNDGALAPGARGEASMVVKIAPPSVWRSIDFRELVAYRDLFWFLTHKAVRTRYAQSALGLAWAVLQPVGTMLVFTAVFGKMVKVDTGDVPYAAFSFVALVPWTYFQSALTEAVESLIAEQNMIAKIYFPRVILPLSRVLARLLDFAVSFVVLIGILFWYDIAPTLQLLWLPVFCAMMVACAGGLGLWLSALAVQYRDVKYGMNFLVRLLMYAAPVVYPASLVPEAYRFWYALNPMVGVVEGFRGALTPAGPMPWDLIVPGAVTSFIMLLAGTQYFRAKERVFADVA